MNILVVEDSATLRKSMETLLLKLGHVPLGASSGVEALQVVGSTDFDLVIMDVEMPGLDGFETTGLMREALGDRWVPIIYYTSHDSDEKVLAGIEAGGDDYLIKPVSHNLLKAKLMSMQRIAEMHQKMSQLNNELSSLSQFDGLTGLLNRRAFTEKAEQCLRDMRRFGKPCAMLMIDVDFFKNFNDHYGHLKGDECLKEIARALKDNAHRECDLVGRYGGEEFVILLPDTDQAGARLTAEKVLEFVDVLNIPHETSAIDDHVTVSIGVDVAIPNERCSLEALISKADRELYAAKNKGRHQVCGSKVGHKTLLIVDEREDNLSSLTDFLQPMGNIITTDSFGECLDLAKEINPDIVIVCSAGQDDQQAANLNANLADHVRTARIPVFYINEMSADRLEQIRNLLHVGTDGGSP